MIYLKTPEEIQKMREAADLVSRTMGEVARWIQPGVTTRKLDTIAREFIHDNGGKPACLGYEGFPGTLCIEVNETVVHGFPSAYALREGDIVGIDTVVELNGYNGDMAYTYAVGDIDPKTFELCKTTYESLYVGIDAVPASASATSPTPSRLSASAGVTRWCARCVATASAVRCTKAPKCPTTGAAVQAPCSATECASASSL